METEHPIEQIMRASMNSIKDMIDVNTIIGDPIETINNTIIIPISKVCFGFAAGGSEFSKETIDEYAKKYKDEEEIKYKLPFGGGTGAGVSINPIAFIVAQAGDVKLIPISHFSTLDRLIDYVPDLFKKIDNKLGKKTEIKTEIDKILRQNKNTSTANKEEQYEIEYQDNEELDD